MNQTGPAFAAHQESPSPTAARRQADAIVAAWARGEPPDTCAALARFPHLIADKSIVLELACEEYGRRRAEGGPINLERFIARFPAYQSALREVFVAASAVYEVMDQINEMPTTALPPWPRAGEQLGDFTLIRSLGRGAFARVYLATEGPTGDRPVVLKVSREEGGEARTLGRLPHPHIVPVLSARVDPATRFALVCMPFLGCATLTDLLDHAFPEFDRPPPRDGRVLLEAVRAAARAGDPLPTPAEPIDPLQGKGSYADAVIHLGAQLADVLGFLHGNGVYHRDLKPSNVLLSASGRPLLLDFNLSLDARLAPPRLGGTLPYMAPEHIRAWLARNSRSPALDGRGDLFALGVILYELLTGRHPFGPVPLGMPNDRLGPLLLERQQAGFRPLRQGNPQVDGPTSRLIEQCLALDPAHRPARALDLAAGMRRSWSPQRRLRRWAIHRPRRAGGLALLALAVVMAVGWGWSQVPPYSERQYRRGVVAAEHGDYAAAVDRFSRTIETESEHSRAYFERGRALLALAEQEPDRDRARALFSSAQSSLATANKLRPDTAGLACWGYACARVGDHGAALLVWEKALQEGFSPRAVLLNNCAYSHMQKGAYAQAHRLLDQALQEDSTLRAAYYNRALVALKTRALRPTALADIRMATDLGPATAQLHYDAAVLFATVCQDDRTSKQRDAFKAHAAETFHHCLCAVQHGYDPKKIQGNGLFKDVLGREVDTLLSQEPQLAPPAILPNLRLLNPSLICLPN